MIYAMDLTPLIADPSLSIQDYVAAYIHRFSEEVSSRLAKFA
jgi:hypothetical protein